MCLKIYLYKKNILKTEVQKIEHTKPNVKGDKEILTTVIVVVVVVAFFVLSFLALANHTILIVGGTFYWNLVPFFT